ncbi:MAG: SDR family NAD(P)-dependent oxidoreductase [Cytophagales bacterium]
MKNYLVLGGSKGIGLAVVKALSIENNVFTGSRSSENLLGLPNVNYFVYDAIADGKADFQLPDELHGLVYCAGSINLKPFHRLTEDDFINDLKINLLGAVKVIQYALPALKKSGNASIVLFSTVAVQTGMGFHASVASAKGAVEGLTRSLAAEFAPTIRVNCIAPSLTNTPLAEKLLNTPEKIEASNKRHPLSKIGQPSDIAASVVFLLSDNASWITGQILHIDGGLGVLRTV